MPASLRAQDVCTTPDHNESPTEPFKWLRDPSQSPCAAAALDVEARLAYGFDGVVFAVGGYSGKLGKDNYSAAGTGSYDFTAHYGVVARWDQAKTSKDLNPGLKDEYVNVGLATHPIKGVDVALVYKHEKMDGGLINSQLAHFRVHVADPADRRAEDGQRASDPVFPLGLRGGSGHGPVDRLRSAACEYRSCDQTVLAAEPRHLI
jgi:hypothetical protein